RGRPGRGRATGCVSFWPPLADPPPRGRTSVGCSTRHGANRAELLVGKGVFPSSAVAEGVVSFRAPSRGVWQSCRPSGDVEGDLRRGSPAMAKSFVHLHVHTEYSMLDGAAKNSQLFAEVQRQGMPAVAMSDHGNMFGAYEFFQTAKKTGIKPIIGIEAYVAPESRFLKKPVFWGTGAQQSGSDESEGGKDVSGGGRYTHMTMWARDARGLRNLFKLSSLASFEGYYMKPRMDRELISQYAEGIIATTGCPSGEVQTRLRLGQYDEALKAAATYQDIFGKENYFLELMDHGIDIEREVRQDLLKIAKELDIPLLAT